VASLHVLAPFRDLKRRRALRVERAAADRDLLETDLPSPRLAWRVEELVSDEQRLALARSVTDLVHDADGTSLPGASPLNRVAVRGARAQLLALASRLADLDRPVMPRGVLLADRLVVDSKSPFYDRTRSNGARRAVDAALQALERRPHG
jgi:hypothetical protein